MNRVENIDETDTWQRVPGNAMLKRAMEVSLVAGHLLCVVTDEDPMIRSMEDISAETKDFKANFAFYVPDGYKNGVYLGDGRVSPLILNTEMVCGTSPVGDEERQHRGGERLGAIIARVARAREIEPLPPMDTTLFDYEQGQDEKKRELVEQSYKIMHRESLSLLIAAGQHAAKSRYKSITGKDGLIERILRTSDSIRRLGMIYDRERLNEKIGISHIAEAVQYQTNEWATRAIAQKQEEAG